MSKEIQIFENKDFGKVRVIDLDGQPWFVGRDVASALGYRNTTRDIQRHVDAEDRGVTEMVTPGGKQKLTVINESGFYSLVISSNLPQAKKFKRWVTAQVLPSIRKHGAYITDALLKQVEEDEGVITDLLTKLQQEQSQKDALVNYIEASVHKIKYHDTILQCNNVIQTSIIAKDYGMSCVTFNKLLADLKIQFNLKNTWVLYQCYANKGYTVTRSYHVNETDVSIQSYWTQRGRKFLYETLCNYGIYPKGELPAES